MSEVVVGGVPLHVQRLGYGGSSPAVFLHGLVMDNLASWYFTVAPAVAATRRVLLYDLRGHGRSGRPERGYGIEELVAELFGLLDAEGVPRATLVGHSFGGTLALAAALTDPARVDGLVLLDPLIPDAGWGDRMADTLALDEATRGGVIAERFAAWLGRHSARKRTKLEVAARGLVEGTSLLADLRASRSWSEHDFRALRSPVRVLAGASSDVRGQSERLCAWLPDVEITWVDGSHPLLWERTDDVRARLVEWLGAGG